jgi:hypothetical protein
MHLGVKLNFPSKRNYYRDSLTTKKGLPHHLPLPPSKDREKSMRRIKIMQVAVMRIRAFRKKNV